MTAKVLGIGAPLIDLIIHVDQTFLDEVAGQKGGMQPIDHAGLDQLLRDSGCPPVVAAGGSAANTLKGLAKLGHSSTLLGKIGSDRHAQQFLQSMRENHVRCELSISSTPTGLVLSIVAPDGSRTFRTWRGASGELTPTDLVASHFADMSLVHIEGYTLPNNGVTQRAMELAQGANAKISLDLASFELVNAHRSLLIDLIRTYVDVVFCNRDEIHALTGKNPREGCQALSELCEIAVVLLGPEGCLVGSKSALHAIPTKRVEAIDTTGAGDLFAAGFLHGYLSGHSLHESAEWGNLLGGAVVQVVGAEIPGAQWAHLKKS